MQTLSYFHTHSFLAALKAFFEGLNVPINYLADAPTDAKTVLGDTYKPDNKAHALMDEVYVLGVVDDAIFQGKRSLENLPDLQNIGKDYYGLLLLGIQLRKQSNGLLPNRSQLAEITRSFNQVFAYTPVSIVFQYESYISFANGERSSYKQAWRDGEKVGKITMLKEVNILNPHAAHTRILAELELKPDVHSFHALQQQWSKVFTTQELNHQFFKKIANWYFWAVANARFPYQYLQKEENYADYKPEALQEIANQKALIRFITRIIFVWFLKEKKLIPEKFFDPAFLTKILIDFDIDKGENYYLAILQNLFFATLNRPVAQRAFAQDKGFLKNRAEDFDINSLYRYENLFQMPDTDTIMAYFAEIPFLNGGLFDSLDKKTENILIDGFSRNANMRASFPNFLLFGAETYDFSPKLNDIYQTKKAKYEVKGLFRIFEEYKFTLEENTPDEQDIALDPVLLGEIFENLLAYYNPETATTARKGTGSFYTPQEIVNYMVEESIDAYLFEGDALLESASPSLPPEEIVFRLSNIKMLDPACGSGAFPMGVLHKIVQLLKKYDPNNVIWQKIQKQKLLAALDHTYDIQDKAIRESEIQKLNDVFEKNLEDYGRKLYIIRNCIYGVDIQDVAIQIAKLRFFLSLVIDQRNENIQPLPNLETKFVVANTLIGVDLPFDDLMAEYDETWQQEDPTAEIKAQLKKVREQHFNATHRRQKQQLKHKDEALRKELTQLIQTTLIEKREAKLAELYAFQAPLQQELEAAKRLPPEIVETITEDMFGKKTVHKNDKTNTKIQQIESRLLPIDRKILRLESHKLENRVIATAQNLAKWDIYDQNAQATWFDSEWMFGLTEGFDVVIGNPPYIGIAKLKDKKVLEKQNFATFESTGDIYSLFYEKGIQLLKEKGALNYITSNKWMKAGYGKSLRRFFSKNNPLKLIDLGAGVFDNATVDTNILLIQKGNTNNLSNLQALDLSKVKNIKNFYHFKTNWLEVKQLGESAWSILNPTQNQIKQKIENIGKPLKDWDIRIVMGIKSGLKSVFEIDPICYEKFCSANNDIETVVFPILHGKDIGKYSVNTDTLNYLIFAKRGFEMAKYPIIKEYLTKYRDDLAKRATINTHPWYELQQPQMGIYLEFEKERIVYPDIVRQPSFSLCKAGIYQDNTTYSLNTNSKYILSLLNSKLLFYYYKFIANNLGENAVRMFSQYVELLPIPELSDSEEAPFIALVDKILALKSGVLDGCAPFENASPSKTLSTQALEAEIDALVYRLYGLSAAEIAMVEGGN